jgi:hypothetical protein
MIAISSILMCRTANQKDKYDAIVMMLDDQPGMDDLAMFVSSGDHYLVGEI